MGGRHMITRRIGLALVSVLTLAAVAAACAPPKEPPPPPPLPPVPVPCSSAPGSAVSGNDPLRTGWYPDQPGLNPSAGGQCVFGEQWAAPVSGQVYARPVVDPGTNLPNGTLVVATESNNIYGFDAVDGHLLWARNLGGPWNSSDIGCNDVGQTVGITSTPAIDTAAHTAYMTSKTYVSGVPTYKVFAIDLTNGDDKSNFVGGVTIAGAAQNDPLAGFDATRLLQRPGLLLAGGVVYAAFGGLCDTPPYRGWVVGVNASTGATTARWTDEALNPDPNPPVTGRPGGGIWQAGGHLVADGGDILVVSGNGDISPTPLPGNTPPTRLGESVIRLRVSTAPLTAGQLQAVDFWTPCNAQDLSDRDLDIGSGAPLVLPTPQFPSNLLLVVGKDSPLYLLHRNNLGGFQQGGAGTCPDSSQPAGDNIVSSFSPGGLGVWASPAVWPGDGGLVYVPYQPYLSSAKFVAYRVSGGGSPTLSIAGQSNDDPYGFGSSSAIVTSTGTTSGSAMVWIVRLPAGDGVGAELRAYDPVPADGTLTLRGRWSVGQGTKFNTPTVHNGRMYVGSRDGFVHAFGAVPQSAAAAQSPPPPRRATTTEAPDKGE
jgi:PQQ-like domain